VQESKTMTGGRTTTTEVPAGIRLLLKSSFNQEEVNVDGILEASIQTGVSYQKDWLGLYTDDVHVKCLINPYTYLGFKVPFDKNGNVHGNIEFLMEEYIGGTTRVLASVPPSHTDLRSPNNRLPLMNSRS